MFFLKHNLPYFINSMKNSVWKHQIIITRPNLAGFKSLTVQPYVPSLNLGEKDSLFPAKAYFCSLVNTLKYPIELIMASHWHRI